MPACEDGVAPAQPMPPMTAVAPMFPICPEDFRSGMLRTLRQPAAILGALAAVLVLALLGPFGTYSRIDMPLRLMYWLLLCGANGACAILCLSLALRVITRIRSAQGLALLVIAASLANALPSALLVASANAVFLDSDPWSAPTLIDLGLKAALITAMFSGMAITIAVLHQHASGPPRDPFDQRIPETLAGDLLALSSEDHYLRVYTSAGNALIHCSLKTALSELSAARGRQVHRSHWVAPQAVKSASRREGQWLLTLVNDVQIPVSRAHLPALKSAGWLHQRLITPDR